MLLLNRTLLHMAKGLWEMDFSDHGVKACRIVRSCRFCRIISGFLGNIASPAMTVSDAGRAVLSALLTAAVMLLLELAHRRSGIPLYGQSPPDSAHSIFSKVLALDVGNIEKIGPVSAITSSVDGVGIHAGLLQPVPSRPVI